MDLKDTNTEKIIGLKNKNEIFLKLLEIDRKRFDGVNMSISEIPSNYTSTAYIDLIIEEFSKMLQLMIGKGSEKEEALDLIDESIVVVEIDIEDPLLLDSKGTNKYYLAKLKGLKRTFSKSNFKPIPKVEKQLKTKSELLKENLFKYGFFELEKLKQLSEPNKTNLIQLISNNKLPYVVAMFDYLDYFRYLEKNHFETKRRLYIEVSKWFNSDKDGRAIKGNISSLIKTSTENKDRYTAFQHKEKVTKDYEGLK